MEAKVVWKSGLSFEGSADSGFRIPIGTTPEVGGAGDGTRPMELIAIGLAGCTAMDAVSILAKKRQPLESFEVQIHAERATEHPTVFTRIVIEYIAKGDGLERAAVERAVQLSAEKYCPAQAMFAKILPLELKITM